MVFFLTGLSVIGSDIPISFRIRRAEFHTELLAAAVARKINQNVSSPNHEVAAATFLRRLCAAAGHEPAFQLTRILIAQR